MQRFRPISLLLLIPALVYVVALAGCGSTPTSPKATPSTPATAPNGGVEPTELASTGWGELTGQVTYDGDPPVMVPIPGIALHKDKHLCEMGDTKHQEWMVDPKTKAVENVVIYLRPPEGKFFKIKDEDKKKDDFVVLDQPHCVYVPHVATLYACYWENGEHKTTGQNLKAINSGKIPNHNVKYLDWNDTVAPDKYITVGFPRLKPNNYRGPVTFSCDVHTWMRAQVWVFDHPYSARTDKEGTFTIKNVPTGAELHVVGWHEEGVVSFEGGQGSVKMTLSDPNPPLSLKVKKK